MKPWLLNILACPIDKHHPLEAYFYKWETSEEELMKINETTDLQNSMKQITNLAKQVENGTISFDSIKIIQDMTESPHSEDLYGKVEQLISKLESEKDKTVANLVTHYPDGLNILHKYLNHLEVEEGLFLCPECGRWYPIGSTVETIPELMPDELREERRDIDFLKKWEKKIPEIVKKEGSPFKI